MKGKRSISLVLLSMVLLFSSASCQSPGKTGEPPKETGSTGNEGDSYSGPMVLSEVPSPPKNMIRLSMSPRYTRHPTALFGSRRGILWKTIFIPGHTASGWA